MACLHKRNHRKLGNCTVMDNVFPFKEIDDQIDHVQASEHEQMQDLRG